MARRKHDEKHPGASRPERARPGDDDGDLVGRGADGDGVADEPEEPGEPEHGPLVRLNKLLAEHGVASRRRCDELIADGKVTVDGEIVTELGTKVDPASQAVEIDGFVLKPGARKRRYYLLNKPAGVVCTNDAREMRPRAVDLVTDPRKGRIFTVGRLDEESKGIIVLTNDGDFAQRITHPRYGIEKTYLVRVAGKIDDAALQKIRNGIHLAEGRTSGARVLVHDRQRDSSWVSVTIHEGMNREVRRVFASVGYKVVELKRTRIGPVTDRGLKIGRWRELARDEIEGLLRGSAPSSGEAPKRRRKTSKRPPRTFSGKAGIQAAERKQVERARVFRERGGPARDRDGSHAPARPRGAGGRPPRAFGGARGGGGAKKPFEKRGGPPRRPGGARGGGRR